MTETMPDETEQLRRTIAAAVRETDFSTMQGGQDLALLSQNTQFESVEVFDDEISISDQTFTGPIVWNVVLVYNDTEGEIRQSDSFPGTVTGRIEGADAIVDEMTADTRSFYR